MKRIFAMLLLASAVTGAMAQATREVKGAVIDKNGNPLPGAKVEATGGAESTVTDADGTFTLEVSQWLKSLTATYPGMNKKKVSIKNGKTNVVFNMSKHSTHWFVNIVGMYTIGYDYGNGSLGVMGGQIGKWGWYAKAIMDLNVKKGYEYANHREDAPGPSFYVGGIKRIIDPLYFYLGVGYTTSYRVRDYSYSSYDSYFKTYNYYSYSYTHARSGVSAEAGFMAAFKKFNVHLGYTLRSKDFFEEHFGHGIHVGAGYVF